MLPKEYDSGSTVIDDSSSILHLSGKNDAKPSYEELRSWVNSGQVEVLRFRH
jgi:hypothetical protein